jgi:DNA polymerase V
MKSKGNRGGQREGAGRPKDSGKYGTADTKPIRVPTISVEPIQNLLQSIRNYNKDQTFEDIAPSAFFYLSQALSEFLDSRDVQELSSMGNSHKEQTEQDQPSNLFSLPIRQPVQRRPLNPEQQSRIYPSSIAASFGVTSTSEQENPSERVYLHQMLVKDPAKTFFLPVAGDSMNQAGINDGDLVVVQQLTDPWSQLKSGSIVTALVDGNPTVKQFDKKRGKPSYHRDLIIQTIRHLKLLREWILRFSGLSCTPYIPQTDAALSSRCYFLRLGRFLLHALNQFCRTAIAGLY